MMKNCNCFEFFVDVLVNDKLSFNMFRKGTSYCLRRCNPIDCTAVYSCCIKSWMSQVN